MNRATILAPLWFWLSIFVVLPVLIVAALSVSTAIEAVPPFTPLLQDPDPASTPSSRASSSPASPPCAAF